MGKGQKDGDRKKDGEIERERKRDRGVILTNSLRTMLKEG